MAEKRLKIAFINIYQSKVERGAEGFVSELANRLNRNHKVDIISGKARAQVRWPILWRTYLDPAGLLVFWFTLKNIPKIWQNKYDVVIALNSGWQVALLRIITWIYGGKLVISAQSGFGWDDRNNLWSFPDRFVALTSYGKLWAQKANPFMKSKIRVIPNGVDLQKFKDKSQSKKGSVILSVGALIPQKRHALAIKAVSKLDFAKLFVVGKGPQKNSLNKLGKKLLGKRFEIKSVKNKDMPAVYKNADVFTFPTEKHEAFGTVLLEAMACGLPVVATNDYVRKEIVGDAGVLVDPTDTDAYAQALQKALSKKWGDRPRKQAEKFSWDKIAAKYEKMFLEITKK